MDEFEQFLKEQPMRRPPANWRREILAALPEAAPEPWWRQLFWPSPVAWVAVAAAWLVIIGLNLAGLPARRATGSANGAGFAVALAERRQLLQEFNGLAAPQPVDPGPHGQLIHKRPEVGYV